MGTLLTNKYKLLNAKKILDIFSSITDNVYCFVGKVSDWAVPGTSDAIIDNTGSEFDNWDDLLFAKKVNTNDVSLVIPYKKWLTGTTYDPYEHDVDLSTKKWYVMTTEVNGDPTGKVYKCISNNSNIASTVQPTTTLPDVTPTSDGYFWKFMYQVSPSSTFISDTETFKWFPIKEVLLSENSTQWTAQEEAVRGEIQHIKSTLAIPSYDAYAVGDPVTIVGNTEGANFSAEIASNFGKKYINITNAGTGYTKVHKVVVDSADESANLKAIISPIGGHGFSAVKELGATALMVTCEFLTSEPELGSSSDTYNEYRKVGLVLNPIVSSDEYDTIVTGGTSISSGTRFVDTTADQRIRVEVDNASEILNFAYDIGAFQGDLDTATARGYVTSKDANNKYMYIITTHGEFNATSDIKDLDTSGVTTTTIPSANITAVTTATGGDGDPKLYPLLRYSGDIIYIDHREKITRQSGKETVRLVIQF